MTFVFRRPRSPMAGSCGRRDHSPTRRRLHTGWVLGVLFALAGPLLLAGGTATTAGSSSQSGIAVLQQQTIALQDGVSPDGYVGTSDAYMESTLPNRPWGVEDPDILRLKSGRFHTLLRFDLSPLPAGAEVLSAALSSFTPASLLVVAPAG